MVERVKYDCLLQREGWGRDHTRSSREDNRRISVTTSFVGEDTEAEGERGDKESMGAWNV